MDMNQISHHLITNKSTSIRNCFHVSKIAGVKKCAALLWSLFQLWLACLLTLFNCALFFHGKANAADCATCVAAAEIPAGTLDIIYCNVKSNKIFRLSSWSWSLTTHRACTMYPSRAIFKTCWQTLTYKQLSGRERKFLKQCLFPFHYRGWLGHHQSHAVAHSNIIAAAGLCGEPANTQLRDVAHAGTNLRHREQQLRSDLPSSS